MSNRAVTGMIMIFVSIIVLNIIGPVERADWKTLTTAYAVMLCGSILATHERKSQ